ncbi:hypothetical protein [Clostridium tagluense]|nr:hypothetical protein [Clostridium tagluense]
MEILNLSLEKSQGKLLGGYGFNKATSVHRGKRSFILERKSMIN